MNLIETRRNLLKDDILHDDRIDTINKRSRSIIASKSNTFANINHILAIAEIKDINTNTLGNTHLNENANEIEQDLSSLHEI